MMGEAIQSLGLGAGGLGVLVAAIAYAVRRIADSRVRLAEARVAIAEARRSEAQTERLEAERSIADGITITTLLESLDKLRADLEGRIEKCRKQHAETDSLLRAALRALNDARRWSKQVAREVSRRGDTPPDMPALPAELVGLEGLE